MGGCRCTYKHCTVKSDGKTHMFHYPVFDKPRCHQWLQNAQREDFLYLKVSQLKNRNVCQHHFKSECFMNFKKDKLTFDAVPTEDGPFNAENSNVSPVKQDLPISHEDIENESLTLSDKNANSFKKYADFLINTTDASDLFAKNIDYQLKNDNDEDLDHRVKDITINSIKPSLVVKKLSSPAKKTQPRAKSASAPVCDVNIVNPPNILPVRIDPNMSEITLPESKVDLPVRSSQETINTTEKHESLLEKRASRKVKIIDDKIIVIPKLLTFKSAPNLKPCDVIIAPSKPLDSSHALNCNENSDLKDNIMVTEVDKINKIENQDKNESILAKSSKLKNKVNHEREATIQQKRLFNKKMSGIIESCLGNIEDVHETVKNMPKINPIPTEAGNSNLVSLISNSANKNDKTNVKKRKMDPSEIIMDHLSKDPELPNINEYALSCIEARMQRMQDILLLKIDQNSQKICDLKKSIDKDKSKKSTSTQTTEESHKKYLFKEISKYLSADANNLIYEELFLNKYAQKVTKVSQNAKKHKNR